MPEVASRATPGAIRPPERALAAADVDLAELDGIAVTSGPGLMGALVVGLAAAKRSRTRSQALYGVNPGGSRRRRPVEQALPEPCVALLVSGGHTSCSAGEQILPGIELGSTIDDAAGEASTRSPGCRGLHYGRTAADRAATGDQPTCGSPRADREEGPRPAPIRLLVLRCQDRRGRWVEARGNETPARSVPDIAASFQEAVCDVLSARPWAPVP